MSKVQLKQLGSASAASGDSPVWSGTEFASGRTRLVSDVAPSFGGTPGAFTYDFEADRAVKWVDSSAPSGGSVTFTTPSGPVRDGQRIALYLPAGNPNSNIVFAIPPGPPSTMTNPLSATEALAGPGVGVSIPDGTYGGPTWLEFEYLPVAPGGEWRLVGDRSGGSPPTWAQALTAGVDSGASSPYVNPGQKLVLGTTSALEDTPGQMKRASAGYEFSGELEQTVTGSGGQSAGTYLKTADLVTSNVPGVPPVGACVVDIDWTLFRFVSPDGVKALELSGVASGRHRAQLGITSAPVLSGNLLTGGIDTVASFDVARLSVGSSNSALALEVLDTPAGSGSAFEDVRWVVFYRVRALNDAANA